MDRRIVLASQSPRRRELLQAAGIEFEIILPPADAEPDDALPHLGESIPQFVQRLARQKAQSVINLVSQPSLIIGCDTVADVDGQLLGKPKDRFDAERMLNLLSGREHSVWSGLCLVDSRSQSSVTGVEESRLTMTPLTREQLNHYLDAGDWQGKSGAFGYQDGHPWLKICHGHADNVVGLPMTLLRELMCRV